jgi:hypothetical protein
VLEELVAGVHVADGEIQTQTTSMFWWTTEAENMSERCAWSRQRSVMQRKIERRPEHTDNRRHSRLKVAARRLLAQAAWRRLARVLGGASAERRGV